MGTFGVGVLTPGWRDVAEILIVSAVLYKALKFLVGTRALQIVFGLLVLALIYVAAFVLRFGMITYLLGVLFTYGAFAAIVVFQPELRSALARLGQSRIFTFFRESATDDVASIILDTLDRLSRTSTGAGPCQWADQWFAISHVCKAPGSGSFAIAFCVVTYTNGSFHRTQQ